MRDVRCPLCQKLVGGVELEGFMGIIRYWCPVCKVEITVKKHNTPTPLDRSLVGSVQSN